MIERDDLRAAVVAGVLTEGQAARLVGLADERRGVRTSMGPSDEPFELFQGLNEIFIVVGLAILYGGWMTLVGLAAFGQSDAALPVAIGSAAMSLLVIWFLSRYFTLKRRMVAPSIALSVIFGLSLLQLGIGLSEQLKLAFQHRFMMTSGICFVGLFVFWYGFQVPFTLALIGAAAMALMFSLSLLGGAAVFDMQNAFLLTAEGPFAIITVAVGLIALLFAMRFDLSDPHRVTRRSANGFWLHVFAAPAIVNTVALTLLEVDTTVSNIGLLAFLMLIAVFAIIIDRRSFLMAAAGYAVVLSAVVLEDGSPLVILLLGLVLVFLGAKWEAIRGGLLARLADFPGKDRLPPWTHPDSKEIT